MVKENELITIILVLIIQSITLVIMYFFCIEFGLPLFLLIPIAFPIPLGIFALVLIGYLKYKNKLVN